METAIVPGMIFLGFMAVSATIAWLSECENRRYYKQLWNTELDRRIAAETKLRRIRRDLKRK